MGILVPLFAAITPFILWPIEYFFPYPHIIEEIAKAILILMLLKLPENKAKIIGAILIGFLFSFTENVLYMFNIFSSGNLQTLILRFVLTMPMHIATSLVILMPALKDKKLIILGVILSSAIHFLFNMAISSIF